MASVADVSSSKEDTPVDDVVATNVAANVADVAGLPVASNVANLSVSMSAKDQISQTDDSTVAKPQIVQPRASRQSIITHTVKSGETVQNVAKQYGISANTVKWANDLTSDALDSGKKLKILPVSGVLYTVESGDSVESIAEKYGASEDRIVAFNNLELDGLKNGSQVIVPSGELPEEERPGYEAPVANSSSSTSTTSSASSSIKSNFMSGSVGNKYAYGYCTWYVYERRAELGRPVGSFWGNANTWDAAASGAGFTVNNTPSAGAVLQTPAGGGGYGHVAVVESVDDAGNVHVTEMNYAGWNVISSRTIPASQASSYSYIH